ncbi:MAG: hypothetical protein VX766_17240 [Pseudomonadota bacterium]|nr:hypothetical protein [Pseudomonadota bacterium]
MNRTTAAIPVARQTVRDSDLDWPKMIEALTGVELEAEDSRREIEQGVAA